MLSLCIFQNLETGNDTTGEYRLSWQWVSHYLMDGLLYGQVSKQTKKKRTKKKKNTYLKLLEKTKCYKYVVVKIEQNALQLISQL